MQWFDWRWQRFDEFKANDLYQMLALRQRIFVIEQRCIYLDADGLDAITEHLTGYDGDDIVACLRLLPPHVKGPEAAIGSAAESAESPAPRRSLRLRWPCLFRILAERIPGRR